METSWRRSLRCLYLPVFLVIDVKYSQHQQSVIQPMDFYLSRMKTDVHTKALCTELVCINHATSAQRERSAQMEELFTWGRVLKRIYQINKSEVLVELCLREMNDLFHFNNFFESPAHLSAILNISEVSGPNE